MKRPLLVIAGPTGVGKTATAVALVGRVPLEVISADSRQVYRGMDLATGKPTPAERRAAAHHLIDVVDPDDRYHAARFRTEAQALVAAVHERGRLPVVVGGTGFYIRALLRGLDPAPPADPEFRRELAALAATDGPAALHSRLRREAPVLARRLHPNDTVRIVRALERLRVPGTASEQVRWAQPDADYDAVYIGLTMERAALRQRLATAPRRWSRPDSSRKCAPSWRGGTIRRYRRCWGSAIASSYAWCRARWPKAKRCA